MIFPSRTFTDGIKSERRRRQKQLLKNRKLKNPLKATRASSKQSVIILANTKIRDLAKNSSIIKRKLSCKSDTLRMSTKENLNLTSGFPPNKCFPLIDTSWQLAVMLQNSARSLLAMANKQKLQRNQGQVFSTIIEFLTVTLLKQSE